MEPPPETLAVTHWSSRLLANHLGIGDATVARAWRAYRVQPWRSGTFKFSTDPELEAKVRDVVGLYLDPPRNAIVLCVDEKSQIQALNRTQPILPVRPGLPEKATHDYKRNGTTTLFAALEVATGNVTDRCYDRHGKAEFLDFLKHVAKAYPRRSCTSCSTTTTPTSTTTSTSGSKHPRITLHFTPTSGSWLNLVEVFFGIITRQAIRRGSFDNVKATRRRDPRLHRRLQRTLPALHLDQDRRGDPAPRHPSTNFRRATLAASARTSRAMFHGSRTSRPSACSSCSTPAVITRSRSAAASAAGSTMSSGAGRPCRAARAARPRRARC